MSDQNAIKIVVDTNLWISFCIGKTLHFLKDAIIKKKVILCFSTELYDEIFDVLNRPTIKPIIKKGNVKDFHNILKHRSYFSDITFSTTDCRDPKDNFILNLAVSAKADYIVTGDKDLLILNPFHDVKIIKANELKKIISDKF